MKYILCKEYEAVTMHEQTFVKVQLRTKTLE